MMIEGDHVSSQRFPIDQDILLADGQDGKKLVKTVGTPSGRRARRVRLPKQEVDKQDKVLLRFRAGRTGEGVREGGVYDLYTRELRPPTRGR